MRNFKPGGLRGVVVLHGNGVAVPGAVPLALGPRGVRELRRGLQQVHLRAALLGRDVELARGKVGLWQTMDFAADGSIFMEITLALFSGLPLDPDYAVPGAKKTNH